MCSGGRNLVSVTKSRNRLACVPQLWRARRRGVPSDRVEPVLTVALSGLTAPSRCSGRFLATQPMPEADLGTPVARWVERTHG
jgi:hypothetical protein